LCCCPWNAAVCSGVDPLVINSSGQSAVNCCITEAPTASSKSTLSACPLVHAKCRGVQPDWVSGKWASPSPSPRGIRIDKHHDTAQGQQCCAHVQLMQHRSSTDSLGAVNSQPAGASCDISRPKRICHHSMQTGSRLELNMTATVQELIYLHACCAGNAISHREVQPCPGCYSSSAG
jgi:hypothetical protein